MTLVRYSNKGLRPFNNLMDDFLFQMPSLLGEAERNGAFKQFPAVNVKEVTGGYEMEVVAPGFEKEQFSIQLEDQLLTISAEYKKEAAENGSNIRCEFEWKSFQRSFSIDKNIDASAICAKYVNGVLTVNLPLKKDVKEERKQITVA